MSSSQKAVIKSTAMDPEMLDYTLARAGIAFSASSSDAVWARP